MKSEENLKVCNDSIKGGHYNAAASRYYYALRLAVQALFEVRNIPVPWITKYNGKKVQEWTHPQLFRMAAVEIAIEGKNTRQLLERAGRYRIKADYEQIPVLESEITDLVRQSIEIFQVISDELKRETPE
ncbi:MAG TPA: HEPN domain-containing protein [bacterium]|jgi:uncharacterized protein (UPF0332 family)